MTKQHLIAAALIATFGAALASSTFAATPVPPHPVDVHQEGEHEGVFGHDTVGEPVEAPEAPKAPEVPEAPGR